jgi:hypothetical protein
MDFGIIAGVRPPDPSAGPMPYAAFEPARYAMGDTVRFAERIDLAHMVPRGDPSSTDYALANEGREYLILQPESIAPVKGHVGTRQLRGRVVLDREAPIVDGGRHRPGAEIGPSQRAARRARAGGRLSEANGLSRRFAADRIGTYQPIS